jgi:hypothetical protein
VPTQSQAHANHEQGLKRSRPRTPERGTQGLEDADKTSVDPSVALHLASDGSPSALRPEHLLALQRTAGNRAVQQMLSDRTRNRRIASQPQPTIQRDPAGAKKQMLGKWLMATFKKVVEKTSATDLDALRADAAHMDELEQKLSAAKFAFLAASMMLIYGYAPGARKQALGILQAQLADKGTARRMLNNGVKVVIVPRDKKMTELTEFASLAGTQTFDGRLWDYVRGVGNVAVGSVQNQAITEENLLGGDPDPSVVDPAWAAAGATGAYEVGYSTSTHEFAHGLHAHGLEDADKTTITNGYNKKKTDTDPTGHPKEAVKPLWVDGPRVSKADMALPADERSQKECYASRNEQEYFAQLSNAYLGTNAGTDPYTRQPRNNGRSWIAKNEPKEMLKLLDKVYKKKKVGKANPKVKK